MRQVNLTDGNAIATQVYERERYRAREKTREKRHRRQKTLHVMAILLVYSGSLLRLFLVYSWSIGLAGYKRRQAIGNERTIKLIWT